MFSQQNIKISHITKRYFNLIIFLIISIFTLNSNAQDSKFTVVLDAGHGGKDPGTLGLANFKNSYESDIALKVVLQIGKLLINDDDIKTIYTRKKQVFIELHKRGKIANKADADLFVSVHCNYSGNKKTIGATTYVLGMGKTDKNLELSKRENDVILLEDDREKNYSYDPNSQEFIIGLTLLQEDYLDKSIEFAQIVQNKMVTVAKRKSYGRGVNQGNLAVLYDSYMPSVLIEIGFLSNKTEEKYLHSSAGQKKIAQALYAAIKTYKNRLQNNSIEPITSISQAESTQTDTDTDTDTDKPKIYNNKYFKVQIATSKRKLDTKPKNFRRLIGVERIKQGDIYKYYYGNTANIDIAEELKKTAQKKGYKDAYIKTFINQNITVEKTTSIKETTPIKKAVTKKTSNPHVYEDIIFKVQISSSVKKISTRSYNFKGLKNIERVKVGKHYKYYYGLTNDYNSIKKYREKALLTGYKSAFIAAFKDGKKVSVTKVLNGTL